MREQLPSTFKISCFLACNRLELSALFLFIHSGEMNLCRGDEKSEKERDLYRTLRKISLLVLYLFLFLVNQDSCRTKLDFPTEIKIYTVLLGEHPATNGKSSTFSGRHNLRQLWKNFQKSIHRKH
jgi:hypothetical protein